jgi:hypothetical protein
MFSSPKSAGGPSGSVSAAGGFGSRGDLDYLDPGS